MVSLTERREALGVGPQLVEVAGGHIWQRDCEGPQLVEGLLGATAGGGWPSLYKQDTDISFHPTRGQQETKPAHTVILGIKPQNYKTMDGYWGSGAWPCPPPSLSLPP